MDKEKFVSSWNNVKDDTKCVMFAGGKMFCTAYDASGDKIELFTIHGKHAEHAVFVGQIDPAYVLEVL